MLWLISFALMLLCTLIGYWIGRDTVREVRLVLDGEHIATLGLAPDASVIEVTTAPGEHHVSSYA